MSNSRATKIEATKPSFVSRFTRTSRSFLCCICTFPIASMGWLPMLLGEIPGHSHFRTLIVRGQRRERIRAHDGSEACVVPRQVAAGLRNADILDAAVAIDAERHRTVKRGGTAHARIDRQSVPIGVYAALCGLNVPAEARGKISAALAEDVR